MAVKSTKKTSENTNSKTNSNAYHKTKSGRTNLPAILFGIFVVLGFVFIIFFRNFSGKSVTWLEESIVIGLIFLYVFASKVMLGLKVRNDQLGDNCYYLGFLYTLLSLSVSLWSLPTAAEYNAIEMILTNFGIAILSTFAGITLRVILNQFRFDPEEIEEASRIELSEATKRVRNELDGSIKEIQNFRRTTIQVMKEGFEETKKDIDKIAKGILDNVGKTVKKSEDGITEITKKSTESSNELTTKLNEFSKSVDNLASKNKILADSMVKVAESLEKLKSGYVDIDGNLKDTFNKNFSQLQESMNSLEKIIKEEKNKKIEIENGMGENQGDVEVVSKKKRFNKILKRLFGPAKR